jgi:hypothetical protein
MLLEARAVALVLPVADAEGVGVNVCAAEGEAVGRAPEPLGGALSEGVCAAEALPVPDGAAEGLSRDDWDAVPVPLPVAPPPLCVAQGVADTLGEGTAEDVGGAEGVGAPLGVRGGEGDAVAEAVVLAPP